MGSAETLLGKDARERRRPRFDESLGAGRRDASFLKGGNGRRSSLFEQGDDFALGGLNSAR